MGTDLKQFVRRAVMDSQGVELSLDEIGISSVKKNPLTDRVDIHASVVLNNAVTRIVVSAHEEAHEEVSEEKKKPE